MKMEQRDLEELVKNLVDDAWSPGDTDHSQPAAINASGYPQRAIRGGDQSVEASYLGLPLNDDDDLSIDEKCNSQLASSLHLETRAAQFKRWMSSNTEGKYKAPTNWFKDYVQTPGIQHPVGGPDYKELAQQFADEQTREIDELLLLQPSYTHHMEQYFGSMLMYDLTMEKINYVSETNVRRYERKKVSQDVYARLQQDPQIEIVASLESIDSEALALAPEFPIKNYDITYDKNHVKKRFECSLVPFYDILIDQEATSIHNAQLVGEATWLTRHQALAKYSKLQEDMHAKLSEHYNNPINLQTDLRSIYDVCCSVQEAYDRNYIIRAIMLGETKEIAYWEVINFMPYVITCVAPIPSTLATASFAKRVMAYQELDTELLHASSINAFEHGEVKTITTDPNVQRLLAGDSQDQRIEVVQNPAEHVLQQPDFAGGILQVNESVQTRAARIYGSYGDPLGAPQRADNNLMETQLREMQQSMVREYLDTLTAMRTREVRQLCYLQRREYEDFDGPDELDFLSSSGYGTGTKPWNIAAKEKIMQVVGMAVQAGIVDPKGLRQATADYTELLGGDEEQLLPAPEQTEAKPSETELILRSKEKIAQMQGELKAEEIRLKGMEVELKSREVQLKDKKIEYDKDTDDQELTLERAEYTNPSKQPAAPAT